MKLFFGNSYYLCIAIRRVATFDSESVSLILILKSGKFQIRQEMQTFITRIGLGFQPVPAGVEFGLLMYRHSGASE